MSSKQSSSTLSPPPPLQQPQTQLPKPIAGTARLPSVSTRPPRISVTSTSNVFRSLSTIHRSTSVLPASLLDLDVASTAGLQVRPRKVYTILRVLIL
ncbi:unnamed protein product [Mesocestoides corti]|uniref:Uncharacterized protein n=2 Tax=Mesocestoides corti TaxID=53468 RepID=A0A0R3UL13_MESCO|nr:unnamed protein product [Mesocestoides corti]